MKRHQYTKEQIDFIRNHAQGRLSKEIHQLFVERFQVDVTLRSIQGIMYRHNIKTNMQGFHTRFQKGRTSWCKGVKGLNLGGEAGWFKKGHLPPSHRPVGSESIYEGVVWIKVKEPNVWRKKHQYIWEEAYGPIPHDMVLRFADGNKMNVTLDNLFLSPKRVFTSVIKRNLESDHPELNKTTYTLAELELAIKDKEKEA